MGAGKVNGRCRPGGNRAVCSAEHSAYALSSLNPVLQHANRRRGRRIRPSTAPAPSQWLSSGHAVRGPFLGGPRVPFPELQYDQAKTFIGGVRMRARCLVVVLTLWATGLGAWGQSSASLEADAIGDMTYESAPSYFDLVSVAVSHSADGLLFTLTASGDLSQAIADYDASDYESTTEFTILVFDEAWDDPRPIPLVISLMPAEGLFGAAGNTPWMMAAVMDYEPDDFESMGTGIFVSTLPAHVSVFRNTISFVLGQDVLGELGSMDRFTWQAASFSESAFGGDILEAFEDPTMYVDRLPDNGLASWPSVGCSNQQDLAVVDIPDPDLRAAIQDTLGISRWADVTLEDLEWLTELDAGYYEISDLTGIDMCSNLTTLDVRYNEISDVSPVADMTQLETLVLWGNLIADLAPLENLTSLKYLDLDETEVSDISALSGMGDLEVLYLSFNAIEDISPLSGLESLQRLYLGWNSISDLSSLGSLFELRTLALPSNPVADVSPLSSLGSLEYLDLARTRVTDIGPLAGLPIDSEVDFGLSLSESSVADLTPLLSASWLGVGDSIDVRDTPAAATAGDVLAPLIDAGVQVLSRAPLETGDLAPDFTLPILGAEDVQTTSLSAYAGQVVILDFWASWCAPCRDSMPELESLVASVQGVDVVLLGVNLDSEIQNALDYLGQNPPGAMIPLGGGFSQANAVSMAYGDLLNNGIPHTFVIDANGTIQYSGYPGWLTVDFIESL